MSSSIWTTKIRNAEKYYKLWSDRFKCEILEDYWEGYQWRQIVDIPYYRPYVVNLIYAELKKKLANMLYQNIEYNLTPRPGNYAGNPEFAFQTASFKQDFLNEIIARANKDNGFNEQVKLTAMDSYFRFGVMEIDYAADWRNPAKKPLITSLHDEPESAGSGEAEKEAKKVSDDEVPVNERIYFKRIKASRFRVAVSDDTRLENCSWCGYYSYIYKHILYKNKKLFDLPKNFENIDTGISSEYLGARLTSLDTNRAGTDAKDLIELYRNGKVLKAWRIWDNENNKFHLILEPNFDCIYEGDFEKLPFATHRHDFRFDGWYPIPPVYQWLSSQDEINQAREQMRNYRRRFTRKFKYWGNIAQEELEKFKSETDGEVINIKNPNSGIEPISNPEIGISIQDALNAGRDDFNVVSGSSSDLSTAQSDRTTATQSKITAMKAQVIESVEQVEFEFLYHKIGRLALLKAQTKFTSGIWVKNSLDPGETFLSQINPQRLLPIKYITIQDLDDGFDVDVAISCVNASPQKMQEEFEKFIKFLTTIMQFPMIALDPTLIREAAFRIGYRNEKVIASMQKVAQLQMMAQAAQQAQQAGIPQNQLIQQMQGNGNGAAGNMMRNAAPSSQGVIDQQLLSQVGQ